MLKKHLLSQETSKKMDDRLGTIFKLQKGLSEMMNLDRYPQNSEGRMIERLSSVREAHPCLAGIIRLHAPIPTRLHGLDRLG